MSGLKMISGVDWKRLARELMYDNVIVIVPRISDEPVYEIVVGKKCVRLVYKFKGYGAFEDAERFVSSLRRKGIKAKIDYDASETEKVFVEVYVTPNEPVMVLENKWFEDEDED